MKNLRYVKRTSKNGQYQYWYWSERLGALVKKPNDEKPSREVVDAHPKYDHHPTEEERGFQVGDIVYDYASHRFGILDNFINDNWVATDRNGNKIKCIKDDLEFIYSNIYQENQYKVDDNLIKAKTNAELYHAEGMGYERADDYINNLDANIRIDLDVFMHIHKLFFYNIYDWAGKIRDSNDEIVVGHHDLPTLKAENVESELKKFFDKLVKKEITQLKMSKMDVVSLILNIHKDLAWIHPFHDGNGRVIRMFCSLLALRLNFRLDWDLEKKKKGQYQSAVKKAVNNNDLTNLKGIIEKSLTQF